MNPLRMKTLIIYQAYQKNKIAVKPNLKEVEIIA